MVENMEENRNEQNKIMIYFPERNGKKGRYTNEEKRESEINKQRLVTVLLKLDKKIDYKLSARGWCYITEQLGYIHKGQFDTIVKIMKECREDGTLPLDFTARDISRSFDFVEPFIKRTKTPKKFLLNYLKRFKEIAKWKDDYAFWENQPYYFMMVVEKIDLKTIFSPICKKYHIPIANAKGWSSKNLRFFLTKKFKFAEQLDKIPILLYYGDFDPYGVKISDLLSKHISQIMDITGLLLDKAEIIRVGLNYDFIQRHNLTWIDNLISGSGKLPNYNNAEVQAWINKYGERKVEANAVIIAPQPAINELENIILDYLGKDCLYKYEEKLAKEHYKVEEICERVGYYDIINNLINKIKNEVD